MATKTATTSKRAPAKKAAKPAVKAPAKRSSKLPKTTINPAVQDKLIADLKKSKATNTSKPAKQPATGSKMDVATSLFVDMSKAGKPRKEIVQAFQDNAGLTKAGSNTYYALIKAKQSK